MNKRLQIEHLSKLLHTEVHMVSSYDGAIERVGGRSRDRLEELRDGHERHVLDITELLREMGEPAPGPSPEVEGLFSPGMAAMRNASDEEDVLHAVRIIEQVGARSYVEARDWAVGMQVHEVLARHDRDEQDYLTTVGGLLEAAKAGSRER
jgi:hypothetical protein